MPTPTLLEQIAEHGNRYLEALAAQEKAERELIQDAKRLRDFCEIITLRHTPYDVVVEKLLHLGCSAFDLDIGVLAKVEGDAYIIEAILWPGGELHPGWQCPLSETVCKEIVDTQDVVSFVNAEPLGRKNTPAYARWGIESYHGAPVTMGNEKFGVLCFCSIAPKPVEFTDSDKNWLRLMAQWIATEGERIRNERILTDLIAAHLLAK